MRFLNSKVAIALAMVVSTNAIVTTFIEDDKDYNNPSLSSGWGWLGIGSAKAAMSCDTDRSETHCSISVDPCDVYNCYGDPYTPPDTYIPPETDYTGGGGDGDPTPTDPNQIDWNHDKINDCWKGLFGSNATGANLSSDWGWRVVDGVSDFHPAWDIGTARQSGVNAQFMGDARVLDKGYDTYNGYWLTYELVTDGTFVKYIHLAELPTVNRQQVYSMGENAGIIGSTGSTNAIHLHVTMYPSKQAYDNAVAQKIGKTNAEKDLIDFRTSIDPASKFNSSACPFPSSVSSSNNQQPGSGSTGPAPIEQPPCPNCQIP